MSATSESSEIASSSKGAEEYPESAALYSLLAATPHTIGELVDFANNLPESWVTSTMLMLGKSLVVDYMTGARKTSRRRRLVIFGALVNRFIFDIEGIPRKRGYRI